MLKTNAGFQTQALLTAFTKHHHANPTQHNKQHKTDCLRFNKQISAKYAKGSAKHKTVYACQVAVAHRTPQATQPRTLITLSCSSSKAQARPSTQTSGIKASQHCSGTNQDKPFNQTKNVILPNWGDLHMQPSSVVIKRNEDLTQALGKSRGGES